ncbi:hypothetical protein BJY01DRAFT_214489 [Aspergillus pseudoustus]|uniref:Uncharacterized protein n=1 Tax=Aspergillus pseudoustus TaxID=1810923 RepID=A0ABR4JYB7_9EURO
MASDPSLPYTTELFASQISQAASRFLAPETTIRPDLIRKPDPITLYLGYLGTGRWRSSYGSFLVARIQDGATQVDRPLTQPEIDAYVESNNGFVTNFRRGLPLGAFAGTAKFFWYEQNYKHFTMYAPAASQERGAGAGGVLSGVRRYVEGTRALFSVDPVLGKQLAGRLFTRLFFWTLGGTIGFQMFAAWTMAASLVKDPRMMQHAADLRTQSPEKVRDRRNQAAKERRQQRILEAQARQQSEESVTQSGSYDQAGYGGDASSIDSAAANASSDTRIYPVPGIVTETSGYSPPAEQNTSTGFFDDDDASPTAPAYRGIVQRENAAAAQGGSAWERLRNQAQNPAASEPASPAGSSWGRDSSAVNNDGQRERDRAQAEFNRMLEAERNQSNEPGAGRSGVWK